MTRISRIKPFSDHIPTFGGLGCHSVGRSGTDRLRLRLRLRKRKVKAEVKVEK